MVDDDDEFEIGSDAPRIDSRTARRRRTRPRALPWVLAAVGLVAAGVVVAPADSLSLDGYPPGTVGMLAVDATVPPDELWRAPVQRLVDADRSLAVVGQVVVVLAGDNAVGLSLQTGEERWRVPVDVATCSVRDDLTCVEQSGDPDAVVLRIDPTDGDQQRMDLPYAVEAIGLGGDVVALTQRDDEVDLQRVGAGGDPRWVSMVDTSDALIDGLSLADQSRLTVVGGIAYLSLTVQATAVDLATGEADDGGAYMSATGYGYLRSDSGFAFTVLDLDGNVVFEDVSVVPDDDPGGPAVHWDGERLAVTGEDVRWESVTEGDEFELPLARVGGVLVTRTMGPTSGDELTGRDVGSGELLWSGAAGTGYGVLTAAGATLVTAGLSSALTGVDAHSGEALWTYGNAPPSTLVLLPDGLVLLLGEEVVRLTWDRID